MQLPPLQKHKTLQFPNRCCQVNVIWAIYKLTFAQNFDISPKTLKCEVRCSKNLLIELTNLIFLIIFIAEQDRNRKNFKHSEITLATLYSPSLASKVRSSDWLISAQHDRGSVVSDGKLPMHYILKAPRDQRTRITRDTYLPTYCSAILIYNKLRQVQLVNLERSFLAVKC